MGATESRAAPADTTETMTALHSEHVEEIMPVLAPRKAMALTLPQRDGGEEPRGKLVLKTKDAKLAGTEEAPVIARSSVSGALSELKSEMMHSDTEPFKPRQRQHNQRQHEAGRAPPGLQRAIPAPMGIAAPPAAPYEQYLDLLAERHNKNVSPSPPVAAPAGLVGRTPNFTSEYMKLLKTGGDDAQRRRGQQQQGPRSWRDRDVAAMGSAGASSRADMDVLAHDLSGALATSARGGRKADAGRKPATRTLMPVVSETSSKRKVHGGAGPITDDPLQLFVQKMALLETERAARIVVGDEEETLEATLEAASASLATRSADEMSIVNYYRQEDRGEAAYWSEPDTQPRSLRAHEAGKEKRFVGAAHLWGARMPMPARAYVTWQPDFQLDRMIARFLLQARRLGEVEKAMESTTPEGSAMPKRFVLGLREVVRGLRHGRVSAVVVAPDIDEVRSKGGLDEMVADIMVQAPQNGVPVIFSLSRRQLGRALGKNLRVSVVGIFSTRGLQPQFQEIVDAAEQHKNRQ